MKKVIAFGTFDILHPGHLHMLKEAREYGDHLTVIVARDETVETVKGKKPIHNEQERMDAIIAKRVADKVRLGNLTKNKYQVIAEEKPDIVALGYDQSVFIDELENAIDDHVQIVRLKPYMPERYKSSLLAK